MVDTSLSVVELFIGFEYNEIDKSEFEEVIKMLILCSNGLSSDMLLSQLSSKVVDCKTAALVVTADNEYKENNYHVPRCVAELQSLNLNVDIFDLDKQPADLLLNYDVVEFIGGNPYYLLHAIQSSNSIDILRTIAETKILIGWSATAFVFGPTLATVYKGNIIKNLIMDCQSYTKYRPNETTGGIFVSWRRKEELPTGA